MRTSAGLSSTSSTTGGALTAALAASSSSTMRIPSGRRQGEVERGTRRYGGFYPDPAAVALHDPAADGEADAVAAVPVLAAEALEHLEDDAEIRGVDAHAVVLHRKLPLRAGAPRRDVHARRLIAVELDRVAHQVLQHALQQAGVGAHARQGVVRDHRALLLGERAQVGEGRRQRLAAVDLGEAQF